MTRQLRGPNTPQHAVSLALGAAISDQNLNWSNPPFRLSATVYSVRLQIPHYPSSQQKQLHDY
jgi:hypothetical protein